MYGTGIMKNEFSNQTAIEEIGNSVTHGIGLQLSIAALIVMIIAASRAGADASLLSALIYGSSLILLYASSTLYHAFWPVRLKKLFKIFDHICIYFLIAGTYTPVLVHVGGRWGWSLLIAQWSTALAGTVLKIFYAGRFKVLSTSIYLVMGWLFVIGYHSLAAALPEGLFPWLLAGGVCYSVGVVFYLLKKLRFSHVVWHLFVLAGSIFHFFGIYRYILS